MKWTKKGISFLVALVLLHTSVAGVAAGVKADNKKNVSPVQSADIKAIPSVVRTTSLGEYRLSKYDVINVAIIGLDESSFKDIMIGPDGYVNLPFAGMVKLSGLTLPEAKALLSNKLGEYIKIPDMAVMVSKYGPRKVYVLGEVRTPGVQTLSWDNMNVIAALSGAGGIALKGRPKHVGVFRQVGDSVQVQEVNFDRLVEKADLSQNIVLQEGDLVYVPKSNKIDLNTDIMPLLNTYFIGKAITN